MLRKFKLLGQLEVLNNIYSELVENEWDMTLILSDNFFGRVYPVMTKMYRSCVD